MKTKTIAAALVLLCPLASNADTFAPSHQCIEPIKPYSFDSQWQVDSFKDEVARYRQCIAEFVQEQKEAIKAHQAAAEQAISDWSDFIQWQLN